MRAFLYGPRSGSPLAQIQLTCGIVRCPEHQRRGEGVEWRWKWNGSRGGCGEAADAAHLDPVVPRRWGKNFTCTRLREKKNTRRIQIQLRKGNEGKSFKDIKTRDLFHDKFIVSSLLRYFLVIIFSPLSQPEFSFTFVLFHLDFSGRRMRNILLSCVSCLRPWTCPSPDKLRSDHSLPQAKYVAEI